MAEKDSRIVFKGQLPHSEIIDLQKNATVLINPRKNTEEFTKYSFPSKNLEYLASGTPVVAYKLDGIPTEYSEHIQYVLDDSVEALKNAIEHICELPFEERCEIGVNARNFVLNQKNAKMQTKKIIDALSSNL